MRRRAAAALLGCLAIAACGGGSPKSSAVIVSASPAASAATTPAAATPSPTAASCRLPLASGDAPVDGRIADGTAGHGGFLQVPDGTFSADGASMGSYDRAVTRWLPVLRAWVSPDGTRYAWGEPRALSGPATGIVHVVNAATGADHPVDVPSASAVVSFEKEGVYVTRIVPDSGAPPQGLTLVDPATGAARQITADGAWVTIGDGAAYGQDVDPALPPPAGVGGPGATNRIRRLDLATGAVTNVSSYPGADAKVLGVYHAMPLIGVTATSSTTVLLGASTTVFTGPPDTGNPAGPVVVDGTTVWFSSLNAAVWRWDGTGRAARVASAPLHALQVAGACR
jgi:hypothetical protein